VSVQWVDMEQTIWGVPGVWSPRADGGSGLILHASLSDNVSVDGHLVDGTVMVRGKDDESPSSVVFSPTHTGHVIVNDGSYGLRLWDSNSEDLQAFGDIDAFDYIPEWVIQGSWKEIPGGKSLGFEHLKEDGIARDEVIPGEIAFDHEGRTIRLPLSKRARHCNWCSLMPQAARPPTAWDVFFFLPPTPMARSRWTSTTRFCHRVRSPMPSTVRCHRIRIASLLPLRRGRKTCSEKTVRCFTPKAAVVIHSMCAAY